MIEMKVLVDEPASGLCVGFDLLKPDGITVLRSYNTDMPTELCGSLIMGTCRLNCAIPPGLLNAGAYRIAPRISIHNHVWIVHSDPLIQFNITLSHGCSPFWNSLDERSRPGLVAPIFEWKTSREC